MPTYAVQKELPPSPPRKSIAPTVSSTYSDDYAGAEPGTHVADVPNLAAKDSYHPSYHAHPRQQVNDYGPQVRQSRLPLFKQVRTMLHKPPPLTTPGNAKWDEYTGELSESGKAPNVKPSTYEAAFKASRKRSPETPNNRSRRNLSPVSVLRDEEITSAPPLQVSRYSMEDDVSPVSPSSVASPVSVIRDMGEHDEFEFVPEMVPEPLSPNVQRPPDHLQTPASSKQIKRKPVSRRVSTLENEPPLSPPQRSPSETSDTDGRFIDSRDGADKAQPGSHFSWTTYAPSVTPGRPSTDTMATRQSKYPSGYPGARDGPNSRFSWSTINTNVARPGRAESPPASPPPPVPLKTSGPPVQSILSRQRPYKRVEKEEWTPPPRKASRPVGETIPESITPTSATTARTLAIPKTTNMPGSRGQSPISAKGSGKDGGKALPLPPTLTADPNQSHLEILLAQERSLALQKRNVEKGIFELEKIEKASPLDVPFATVRDAKKRLAEYRKRLAEVVLEERDVGIAITRARRKEEEENGFDSGSTIWIRRVTS